MGEVCGVEEAPKLEDDGVCLGCESSGETGRIMRQVRKKGQPAGR